MVDAVRQPPKHAVGRAWGLLQVVVSSPHPMSLQEIALQSGLAGSTAHRTLHLLVDQNAVEYDPLLHRYSVGTELYRMAALAMANRKIIDQIQPGLQMIATEFNETALFAEYIPSTGSVAFIARADGDHLLQYRVTMEEPTSALIGSSGRAVAAHLDAGALDRLMAGFVDDSTVPGWDESELRRELDGIRSTGYAVSEGEKLPEARGIAVPVFGPRGVLGSMCLTYPKRREAKRSVEEIGRALTEAGKRLSHELGGRTPSA